MNKNMRQHEDHEADSAYGAINLFCKAPCPAKQIFACAIWGFCLMLPHIPHESVCEVPNAGAGSSKTIENMRIMRMYEEGLFNGFYLPCKNIGVAARPKHEASMRIHEDDSLVSGLKGRQQ